MNVNIGSGIFGVGKDAREYYTVFFVLLRRILMNEKQQIENIQRNMEKAGKNIWDECTDPLKKYGFDDKTSNLIVAMVVARIFGDING